MSTRASRTVWREGTLVRLWRTGGLVALMFAAPGVVSAAELHTFTNKDGRTINATITDVSATEVSIKRDDGQTFKISLATFSDADQDYIRQWAINEANHWKGVFDISSTENRTVEVRTVATNSGNGTASALATTVVETTTTAWQAGYKIKLKNQIAMDLKNLHADYVFFWTGSNGSPSLSGSMPIALAPSMADATVETDKAPQQRQVALTTYNQYIPATQRYVTIGSQSATVMENFLSALWLRIYDDKERLVQEWSSNPSLTKELKWGKVYSPPSASPDAGVPVSPVRPPNGAPPASSPPSQGGPDNSSYFTPFLYPSAIPPGQGPSVPASGG